MGGTGVPLTADQYPQMHALLREPLFGFPVQTLWMVAILIVEWLLLNRTRFGAHVFLIGDNQISARLMGVNVARVKIKAFVLVGVTAVFCGLMSSIYGYYFWPSTGEGSLLNTIASVFLGGTSVFGGTGSVVGHLRRLVHHRRDQRGHRVGGHQRLLHPARVRPRDRHLGRAADPDRPAHPPPVADRALSRVESGRRGNSRAPLTGDRRLEIGERPVFVLSLFGWLTP